MKTDGSRARRVERQPTARVAVGRPGLGVERSLWRAGHQWVAGVDEVGRGAWAGPLSVGVAVIHPGVRLRSMPRWLRDSKALAEERREAVFGPVARWCADAAVGHAMADECDRYGMTFAWRLAAYRALAALEVVPDAIVIDGPHDLLRGASRGVPQDTREAGMLEERPIEDPPTAEVEGSDEFQGTDEGRQSGVPSAALVRERPELPFAVIPETVLTVVDGDAKCAAVAAASVLAKVVRDRAMRAEAEHFPPYGFDRNKGYPSTRHQIALRGYGLSAIHRRSWAYVAGLPLG